MARLFTLPDPEQVAQDQFGYPELHPGQQASVQAILDGKDTLVIMPTGSGKSAIYQIAAYLLPGSTVVVSPLIALQRDQVQSIADQEIGEAAVVNSTLSATERQATLEDLEAGHLEFLFLAPEQFNSSETLDRLQAANLSLFVVDEAHCISTWGHDFRPDYLRLGPVIAALGHPRILALTATAAPPVRQEIVERLGMQQSSVIVEGFDRPNIRLAVERFDDDQKEDQLLHHIIQAKKPGIVYVASRKGTEDLTEQLKQQGIRAQFYHAGMKAGDRQQTEAAFMADEIDVLVATTAFGMGIDKPNVRFVFHANISDSLDSYYQEIGRAGRDGEAAQALLFYNPEDLNLRRFLAGSGQVSPDQVQQVLEMLQQQTQAITPKELQAQVDLSKSKLRTVLNHLVELGAIEISPIGEVSLTQKLNLEETLRAVSQAQERYRQFERSRLEMMRNYAEVRSCRREYLLNYFGENYTGPCEYCDNCQSKTIQPAQHQNPKRQPYPLESQVIHKSWGEGTVMRYEAGKIVILFNQVGYKTLDLKTALLRQLLRRKD